MINKFIRILLRHKDVISYVFFGVLTTIVNIITYYILCRYVEISMINSVIIAWILAVLFAYLTNRYWVFHSSNHAWIDIIKECMIFYWCRILTGILDIVIMWLGVEVFSFNDVVIKTISNITIIILNYLASRFIIFR